MNIHGDGSCVLVLSDCAHDVFTERRNEKSRNRVRLFDHRFDASLRVTPTPLFRPEEALPLYTLAGGNWLGRTAAGSTYIDEDAASCDTDKASTAIDNATRIKISEKKEVLSFQQSVTRIHTRTRHCAHNAQLREPHFRQAALRPKKLKSANTTRCQRIDVIHLEYACLGEHRTTAGVIVQASHATCKRALLSVFITTDPPAGTHMEASQPR